MPAVRPSSLALRCVLGIANPQRSASYKRGSPTGIAVSYNRVFGHAVLFWHRKRGYPLCRAHRSPEKKRRLLAPSLPLPE